MVISRKLGKNGQREPKKFSDPSKAFASAEQIRLALRPLLSWEKAAEQFSSDIETILT